MKRRQFLQQSASLGLFPLVAGALPFRSLAATSPLLTTNCNTADRSVVIIFLNGANDIFNTTVPLSQFSEYVSFRPTIHLPEQSLITLDSNLGDNQAIGLHPRMQGFKNLYDDGLLTLVQGVGYDQPNRSHFKATDNWLTGSGGNLQNLSEGWVGRFLDDRYPGYSGIPFDGEPDPLGILLGNTVSTGFHSNSEHRMEINLSGQDPAGFYTLISSLGGVPLTNIPDTEHGGMLSYLETISQSVNVYAERISDTFNSGTNVATYPDSSFGNQLRTIARMLAGGSRTKIFMAGKGGWDNHNYINTPGMTTEGTHADLLGDLSDSVAAFQDDLQAMGLQNNVLTVIFSEFGRKIIQNGSQGNDHGTLSSMFIVGAGANGGVVGNNINLSDQDNPGAPNPSQIQHDYRQVFSSVLQDWLGANDNALQSTFIQPNYYTNRPDVVSPAHTVGPDCYFEPQVPIACACIRVKLLLEGYYRPATGAMSTDLLDNDLLPMSQPFNRAPYDYYFADAVSEWPADTVDWVLVELRDADDLSQIVARKAVLLRKDGQLMGTDGTLGVAFDGVPDGAYHLAIIHQNHLGVISANPIVTNAPSFVYDFTTASHQAIGRDQLKEIDQQWMLLAGDMDHNHHVNNQDYNHWKTQSGNSATYDATDLNADGAVDGQDLDLWKGNRSKIGALKSLLLLLVSSLFGLSLPAQQIDVLLTADKDCNTNNYCVDVQFQAGATTDPINIGTSSLLLSYNPEALAFQSYTSERLDGGELCTGGGGAWAVHQFDAYSKAGEFHLVLFLEDEIASCPTEVTTDPIVVGRLCFDIQQQGGQSSLSIDPSYTFFNQQMPNDGSESIPLGQVSLDEPAELLACDCPGAGQPCDDQDIYTINDSYDLDCNCRGTLQDKDADGIPDGIDPCEDLTFEAEAATYVGALFRDNHARFYGSGFLDFGYLAGEYVDFEVDLAEGDDYTLAFRYAASTDRYMQLVLDGVILETRLFFPATVEWDNWQDVEYTLNNLGAGLHTIRLEIIQGAAPNVDQMRLSRCTDCTMSGQACDDNDPCTVDDIYDANCNCGGRIVDVDGDLIADPCDPNVGDADDLPLEVGFAKDVGSEWITIELDRTYESMVVIATPQISPASSSSVVTRVRNATGNSFELKLQNPGGSNPFAFLDNTYHVFWVVVEEGVYRSQYDGMTMEVRREVADMTSDRNNWEDVNRFTYQQSYRQPIVLGQVLTTVNEEWSTFYATAPDNRRNIPDPTGFAAGKHKGEDLQTNRDMEMMGILVLEAGTYTIRDLLLEAGTARVKLNSINAGGDQHDLQSDRLRGAILSANSMDGTDGYWPVLFGLTPVKYGKLSMACDEDQIRDEERRHNSEEVGYLAFEEIICYDDTDQDGVCNAEDQCPGSDDALDEDGDGIPDGCDDCNDKLAGTPCDDGQPCTILDRYTPDCGCAGIPMDSDGDGVCNWDDICPNGDDNLDTDGDGVPDPCDPNVGDATTMPIETGIVAEVTEQWQTITLHRTYQSMVVVATPRLEELSKPPVVTRIRNASGNTFDLRVQNPSGAISDTFQVHYTVVEEGVYQSAYDGIAMEASRMNSAHVSGVGNWGIRETRAYEQSYQTPVVLGQVMTHNDARWSVFWASLHNSNGSPPSAESIAAGRHIGGDTITERLDEVLGLIVIEAGLYQLGGLALEAQVGEDTIIGYSGNPAETYPLSIVDANGAVASAAGMDGGDGYWPVLRNENPIVNQELSLMADEDQISDTERYHTTEQVAVLAFRGTHPGSGQHRFIDSPPPPPLEPVNPAPARKLVPVPAHAVVLYPNPTTDLITIEGEMPPGKRELFVYDAHGQLVLQQIILQTETLYLRQQVDLQRLPAGSYYLQLRSGDTQQTLRVTKLK